MAVSLRGALAEQTWKKINGLHVILIEVNLSIPVNSMNLAKF